MVDADNYLDCMDDENNFKTGLLDCCRDDGKVKCCRKYPLPMPGPKIW